MYFETELSGIPLAMYPTYWSATIKILYIAQGEPEISEEWSRSKKKTKEWQKEQEPSLLSFPAIHNNLVKLAIGAKKHYHSGFFDVLSEKKGTRIHHNPISKRYKGSICLFGPQLLQDQVPFFDQLRN
ncbi:hypothetical protein ACJX0J_024812, partial [Zea mays]